LGTCFGVQNLPYFGFGNLATLARIEKEKLAFEVEKYVFLYDKSHAKYKNRNATDQAWAAIASELRSE